MSDLFDLPFEEPEPEEPVPSPAPVRRVLTVSELTGALREVLETTFPEVWVEGELSNAKVWTTGHLYFTLKDGSAQIKGVMFRSALRYLKFKPEDGLHVVVRGRISVYDPKGEYQIVAEHLEPHGLGPLQLAFEQLKKKLAAEGLFETSRKRQLPSLPRRIGVVTSIDGAALRDIIRVLRRRYPNAHVVIAPCRVQGDNAAGEIVRALRQIARIEGVDVVIVARGGGSLEDLWAFNEEKVARAIAASPVPIISGIGHETDFTIADFVADARAPTPTAAAGLASPARDELSRLLLQQAHRLLRVTRRALEERMQRLDFLTRRLVHPGERIRNQLSELRHLATRLAGAGGRALEDLGWQARELGLRLVAGAPDVAGLARDSAERARRLREAARRRIEAAAAHLARMDANLKHLNPQSVLERGYSITEAAGGTIVRDAARLKVGEDVTITFARGLVGAQVKRKA